MKSLCIQCALLLTTLHAHADNLDRQQFIHDHAGLAISEMVRTGVPASLKLAQAALESNWGKGTVAVAGKNFFGIKCHNGWRGKCMQEQDDEVLPSNFRIYGSVEESFKDHSDFLRSQGRYKQLFQLPATDYRLWAYKLKECGYATDQQYPEKLIRIIEENGLASYDLFMPVTDFTVLASSTVPADSGPEAAEGASADTGLGAIDPASFRVLDTPVVVESGTWEEDEDARTAPAYRLGELPSGDRRDGSALSPKGVLGWGAPLLSEYW